MPASEVKTAPKPPPLRKPPPPPPKTDAREEAVNGIFQLVQFGAIIFGQYADAGAIGLHGPAISHETATLANQKPGVGKAIDTLLEVGPYAALITAVMPLTLQVLVNHKVLKAESLVGANVVTPEALAADVKTSLAKQQSDAMKRQAAAEMELAVLQEEMASANGRPEKINE